MASFVSGDSFSEQQTYDTAVSRASIDLASISGTFGESSSPEFFVRIGSVIDAASFWVSQVSFDGQMTSLNTVS